MPAEIGNEHRRKAEHIVALEKQIQVIDITIYRK
jgi:hypothetical protein